jgi:hypothetical protein
MNRAKIAQALCIPTSELEQLLFGLAMTGIEGGKRSTTGTAPTQLQRVK